MKIPCCYYGLLIVTIILTPSSGFALRQVEQDLTEYDEQQIQAEIAQQRQERLRISEEERGEWESKEKSLPERMSISSPPSSPAEMEKREVQKVRANKGFKLGALDASFCVFITIFGIMSYIYLSRRLKMAKL